MTYGDKIRSMNDKQLADFLSKSIIPADECESVIETEIVKLSDILEIIDNIGKENKE